MPLQDLRRLGDVHTLDADVCVIGSGPAGWVLAEELGGSPLRVLVLESGGVADVEAGGDPIDPDTAALAVTRDVGRPLFNGRRRGLGGTCEVPGWGNRCIALDPIDYERREWVPHSGWPFGPATIKPYLDRASKHLGLGDNLEFDAAGPPRLALDEAALRQVRWSFGRERTGSVRRFGRLFRQGVDDNVRVLVNATVTHIDTNAGGARVGAVEVVDRAGRTVRVRAQAVVLCAGGIENARLLLLSNRQRPRGLGNDRDLVGRYLMDHPRDLNGALAFDARDVPALAPLLGHHLRETEAGWREVVGGFALGEAVQRREQLLNCAAWPILEPVEADPVIAARRLKRRESVDIAGDAWLVASDLGAVGRAARAWLRADDRPLRRRYGRAILVIGSEQTPDPDSRITLAAERDPLGLPIAQTDWRVGERELRSQMTLARLIEREFGGLRLPRPRLAAWIADNRPADAPIVDGCHPTGTTRMATDPREGVVDANCQVHGVDGLFVGGSSVFPTAGHANPTLTIAALAVRLADHLRARIAGEVAARPRAVPAHV